MSAIFSPDNSYRYLLYRDVSITSSKVLGVLGVNPSKAGSVRNDPTVRKLIGFADRAGYGKLVLANKFAYIATDVSDLANLGEWAIGPANDSYIERLAREADRVVVAWGPLTKLPKALRTRWVDVVGLLRTQGHKKLYCWGTTKSGDPRHPLMVPYSQKLEEWRAS